MGTGIAHLCLAAGMSVALTDTASEALETALERLAPLDPDGSRLLGGGFESTLDKAEVVLDATPQDLPRKQAVLDAIYRNAPPNALLGTVTLVTPLATLDPDQQWLDRLVGLHFMNPPHKLRFCEVVVREGVATEAVERSDELLTRLGVKNIHCDDTPGFVLNSALVPFLLDAVRLLERGAASATDIDLAFTAGCGHPMGPLAIIDLLGLDVTVSTADALHTELGPSARCEPPALLREVAARRDTFHPARK